jgi:hypothetical protein
MEEQLDMNPIVIRGLRRTNIERRKGLSSECVYRDYLTRGGIPVIVTDATKSWKALSTWSLDFFKQNYGSETVVPGIGIYGKSRRVMKIADFLDYVELPTAKRRGFWIDLETKRPREERPEDNAAPLYLHDQNLFLTHSNLLEDVTPNPDCIDDWLALLPEDLQRLLQSTRYYQRGLLIGPKDSVSNLHYDFLDTHAYLAPIIGKKLCILFSPEDSDFLYDGAVNPEIPDVESFPLFSQARAFLCILEPGELLLIPSRWWHYVRNLEKTITVNYNFFNRSNFGQYFISLFRVLPQILDGFDTNPDWQYKLGIKWKSKGFGLRE